MKLNALQFLKYALVMLLCLSKISLAQTASALAPQPETILKQNEPAPFTGILYGLERSIDIQNEFAACDYTKTHSGSCPPQKDLGAFDLKLFISGLLLGVLAGHSLK